MKSRYVFLFSFLTCVGNTRCFVSKVALNCYNEYVVHTYQGSVQIVTDSISSRSPSASSCPILCTITREELAVRGVFSVFLSGRGLFYCSRGRARACACVACFIFRKCGNALVV